MLASRLLRGAGVAQNYAEDVFSTYTYTGTGAVQTITNGIDLLGSGGLVWVKQRSSGGAADGWGVPPCSHILTDTVRGMDRAGYSFGLRSNGTNAEGNFGSGGIGANSNGFTVGYSGFGGFNYSGETYVSWTFRKAPKFFDCGTFVAGSATNRRISHALSAAPGMVILKRTDSTDNWSTYHRSLGASSLLSLNTSAAAGTIASVWGVTDPTAYDFGVNEAQLCTPGGTYVWYAFAHDTGTDGLIQCGSFTTDGSGNATVNLGWEPQYLMFKTANSVQNWTTIDSVRGMSVVGDEALYPNASAAAQVDALDKYVPNATGFTIKNNPFGASKVVVYLAIRRPNKPPTVGTQVFSPVAFTSNSNYQIAAGFRPDTVLYVNRDTAAFAGNRFIDQLRGVGLTTSGIATDSGSPEGSYSSHIAAFTANGATWGAGEIGYQVVAYMLKRAPGVFDVVCYTGTGSAHSEAHNLGVAPELMIVKRRSTSRDWCVYSSSVGTSKYLALNLNYSPTSDATIWNGVAPTSSVFSVGNAESNNAGDTYVAYLFATKGGISKVGSYTGNGGTQTIDCGFTTGARFVLIKRTSAAGDWFVWDTAHGIVAGNDPHLSLNTSVAEVTTDDSIDPNVVGFDISQLAATNINVISATYIFLAFA